MFRTPPEIMQALVCDDTLLASHRFQPAEGAIITEQNCTWGLFYEMRHSYSKCNLNYLKFYIVQYHKNIIGTKQLESYQHIGIIMTKKYLIVKYNIGHLDYIHGSVARDRLLCVLNCLTDS